MNVYYGRPLERASVTSGDAVDVARFLDLGPYGKLHFVATVLTAAGSDTSRLVLKHAPVNMEEAYIGFETPVEIDLSTVGTQWFHVESFTRFVGWFASGEISGDCMLTLDVVAKP